VVTAIVVAFTALSYYLQWYQPVLYTASLPGFRSLGIGFRVDLILDLSSYFLTGSLLFLNEKRLKANVPLFILSIIIWFAGANVYLWNQYISLITTPFLVYQLAYLPIFNSLNKIGKYGDFSYGLYIWAFPVQQILVFYLGSSIPVELSIALTTVITLVISALSWRLIEKPAMALK
jgi:peptidoglycan/LPS O-acetylase OafA/YrhL